MSSNYGLSYTSSINQQLYFGLIDKYIQVKLLVAQITS